VIIVIHRALSSSPAPWLYGRRAAVLTVIGNTLGEYLQVIAVHSDRRRG